MTMRGPDRLVAVTVYPSSSWMKGQRIARHSTYHSRFDYLKRSETPGLQRGTRAACCRKVGEWFVNFSYDQELSR